MPRKKLIPRQLELALWLLGGYAAVLTLVLAVFGLRLRHLTLESAPLELWLPFVRPLLFEALEGAFLLAAPAVGLWAHAQGLRLIWLLPITLLLSTLVQQLLPRLEVGKEPGVVAQEILDATRESCLSSEPRKQTAPVLKLEWSCPEGGPTRVTGKVPMPGNVRFAAEALTISPDLREMRLRQLKLTAQRPRQVSLNIAAGRVHIRGMKPWGLPQTANSARRGVALIAGWITLLAGLALFRLRAQRALLALVVALLAAMIATWVLRSFDPGAAFTIRAYALVVLSGPVALCLGWLLLRPIQRRFGWAKPSVSGPI